ncbi:putative protein-serine/threonine kinase CMGC-CDKL-Os family [Helianthus annuus]|uniref:Protein kinase domain-containing protein n=1 Tax=Helianthus annuus TaxID=4232 RepID=A0A251UJW4_HELAN|nr:putative protein-serine/threonine kinase CMGC-CDKL-Os family [Helianthus annuus]KAJ0572939.1 putative protein-serine/threonine kinase CMGC-CDKL-Os family [Helianthus annuus]KAJ0737376.1 putative protein-serine/threonine kinase CMGC-CDKL-Os family [Helianthus annuus]
MASNIDDQPCLVFEFLERDLQKLINYRPLPTAKIQKYMFQLCKGLECIQGLGMLGLDEFLGTPGYKAPEILLGMIDYYVGVDIWSLGCIFGMFLTWFQDVNICFLICSVSNMYCKIVQLKCQREYCCLLVLVVMRMLTYKPARRISAHAALEHPYFAKLRCVVVF